MSGECLLDLQLPWLHDQVTLLNPCHMDNDCNFFVPKWSRKSNTENKILVIVFVFKWNALNWKQNNNVCKHDAMDSVEIKGVGPINLISPRSAGIASLTIQGKTFSEAGLAVLQVLGLLRSRLSIWEVEFLFFSTFRNYTLQGTNISHLGKWKIIFKIPFLGGYVSSLEGTSCIMFFFLSRLTWWFPNCTCASGAIP